jgi:FAD/FMN-containing dehydrogenase
MKLPAQLLLAAGLVLAACTTTPRSNAPVETTAPVERVDPLVRACEDNVRQLSPRFSGAKLEDHGAGHYTVTVNVRALNRYGHRIESVWVCDIQTADGRVQVESHPTRLKIEKGAK